MAAEAIRNLYQRWRHRRQTAALVAEAEKGALALDIMLEAYSWYGGIRVVEGEGPGWRRCYIEVLISDAFPGAISTYVPPRVGVVPVFVRFGKAV